MLQKIVEYVAVSFFMHVRQNGKHDPTQGKVR